MNNTFSIDIDAWKNHIDEIQDILKTIASDSQCRMVLGDDFCSKARDWNKRITESRHTPYTIVICGEFKRGKSSLINALLGETIAPVDVTPETVTINTICYGKHRNEAVLKNGKRMLLTDDEIHRENLLKLNRELENEVTRLMLYRPIEMLRRVNIIDTPGLNEAIGLQEELTKQVVGSADAVLYTFVPNSPLSMTEQLFLRTFVLARKDIDLFLVCNKTDMIDVDDQESFRNWMNGRVADILKGIRPYYVSALDEICAKDGRKRPNPEISESLELEMRVLRDVLEQLIEDRSEMAMPNRVNRMVEAMKIDIEEAIAVMEQGATMSEKEVEDSEEKVHQECLVYESLLKKLKDSVSELLDNGMESTKKLIKTALELMEEDAKVMDNISNEDLVRYYPFFCMDKLQESLELCYSHDLSKITELFLDNCGQEATQILDQNTNVEMKISFAIDNQTWTKGDNIGFVGHQFNLGLLTYVIDGVAGALRNKELHGKKADVQKQILEQYDGLKQEAQESVTMTYCKLKNELNAKLNAYFQNKSLETQDRMEKAKEIASLGTQKKEQIYAATEYVRGLLKDVL